MIKEFLIGVSCFLLGTFFGYKILGWIIDNIKFWLQTLF
jgi:hypothetical protein